MIEKYKRIPRNGEQYPADFISSSKAMILEKNENETIVGITERTTGESIDTLKIYHRGKIKLVTLPLSEFSEWMNTNLTDNVILKEEESHWFEKEKDLSLEKFEKDAPAISIVNGIILEAINNESSDIHIEAEKEYMRVRYRINGSLITSKTFQKDRFDSVSSRIKIMAGLNIIEKRQPQDGRISLMLEGKTIDLRVSSVPTTEGESIVLRLLGRKTGLKKLEDLNFSTDVFSCIKRMICIPQGLIIVTGPTGSGKTTTLNAILRELVTDDRKIITIEDPVEFSMEGVSQIQINEQTGFGFETILRRVLRQDPDIIMVGEIRDDKTARLCIRAAMTGHLVLSTLHTNDASGVVSRLTNMGIEPYLTASVLKGCIAQRLVRRTDIEGKRTVISEAFFVDEDMAEKISTVQTRSEIHGYLKKKGMRFLKDDALRLIKSGITSENEIRKEIEI